MPELTPKQAKILSAASLQARASFQEIAKEAGVRPSTVSSVLRYLRDSGYISSLAVVNAQSLGFRDYCFFFSLLAGGAHTRRRIIEHLASTPSVVWVAELGGRFSFSASVMVRSTDEVQEFLNAITRAAPEARVDTQMAVRVAWVTFRPKYLSTAKSRADVLERRESLPHVAVDRTDGALLRALTADPTATLAELGRAAQLSTSGAAERMRSLEKRGVLLGTMYHVNTERLGMHTFRLLLTVAAPSSGLRKRLYTHAARHPNITRFVECFGNWHFELNVDVKRSSQISDIEAELESVFGGEILRIEAVPLLRTAKASLTPPLASTR